MNVSYLIQFPAVFYQILLCAKQSILSTSTAPSCNRCYQLRLIDFKAEYWPSSHKFELKFVQRYFLET